MSQRDSFRRMYGDELADQVEQLKRKPRGVEVLPVKPRKPEPKQQEKRDDIENWWDK